ncbi:alpha/beta fold hydrolase [Streptomyces sp. NPDC086549]|uniref:alpha/beta fold hydrolase n=1 Tax=Streptomyces sp. NPDC086549 TaxID=3365752 RepID=UPI0037FEC6CA
MGPDGYRRPGGRPVVLFDNVGVGETNSQTPDRVETQAKDAATFAAAIGLTHYDVLGFSIGGYVVQALTLQQPHTVRRVVLAGTQPRAGDTRERHLDVNHVATRNEVDQLEDFQFLFFPPSARVRPRARPSGVAARSGRSTGTRTRPGRRRRRRERQSPTGKSRTASRTQTSRSSPSPSW